MRLPRSVDELRGLRAARWIRESTAGQVDRYGPASQREQQDRALERHELIDAGLSWEVAHSGRTVAGTQAFADMLAAAGRDFDVLLVGYVSRFARDLRTAVNARHDLHAAGAALLFCDERLLSSDDDAWESWAREAVEAEAYSRRLGRRIREAYAAKFRAGDQGGTPGLGFYRTPAPEARLAIDVDAMPRAVALFERYATGLVSLRQLEAETGIPADAIRAILANPLYNGWAVRHRRSAQETRTPAPWRSSPPVDDVLWSRVQAVRADRHTGGGGQRRRIHLLAGRVWCSCGRRVRSDTANPKGYTYRRYRHDVDCGRWATKSVRAELLEEPIARQVGQLRLDARLLASLRALAGQQIAAPASTELRRRQLQRELEAKARAFGQRQLTLEALQSEHARIGAELDALEERPSTTGILDPDAAIVALRDLRAAWRDADDEARAGLVRALFDRVVVEGGRVVEEELTPWARRHGLALALPPYMELARPAGVAHGRSRYPIRIIGRAEELAAVRRARSA